MAHLALACAAGILHRFRAARPARRPSGRYSYRTRRTDRHDVGGYCSAGGWPSGSTSCSRAAASGCARSATAASRQPLPHGRRSPSSSRRATRPTASPRPSARCCARTIAGALDDHPGRRRQQRRHRRDRAPERRRRLNAAERLQIIDGQPLPRGWTGKLWAVKQGVEAAQSASQSAGLPPAVRCRHRLRAGRACRPGGARRMPASSCSPR